MIDNFTVLALIPARGGSKGVPRKNVIKLAGRPLIVHTIDQARKSKYIDKLVLSSDDDEIINVAQKSGCEVPFKRPQELASDKASAIDVIRHALQELDKFDYVVFLQPTSPFRTSEDIDKCIEKCILGGVHSCVSVSKVEKSPYWMYTLDQSQKISPLLGETTFSRRQDTPDVYALNGAVYVLDSTAIMEGKPIICKDTLAYVMPAERALDIDSMLDLKLAEVMFEAFGNNDLTNS